MSSAHNSLKTALIVGIFLSVLFINGAQCACRPAPHHRLPCANKGQNYEAPGTGCQGYVTCTGDGGPLHCCRNEHVYKPGSGCVPKGSYRCQRP